MPSEHAPRVVLVAAVADNGVIGADGGIPWSIPEDLRHFREVTTGRTVLMGRATYDSIGRPLPRRTNLVLTRDPDWTADGVEVVRDLDAAVARARAEGTDLMVIGGAQVYALALPAATHQVLTEVHSAPDGDTRYPAWDRGEWSETRREAHPDADPPYDFTWWSRAVADGADGADGR